MRKKKYVNRNTQTKAMKTSVTDLQEIVKAALKEAMSEEAVSYTHLDVYKRQK